MHESEDSHNTILNTREHMVAPFVSSTAVVDGHDQAVTALADELGAGSDDELEITRRCFEWVRENIEHSIDFGRDEVTCNASEVLKSGTGLCYAKSHLLAALLRANRIPVGFCYQRLSIRGDGTPFCLHGLNAIRLDDGSWYRIDARGDKSGIDTDVVPPVERIAFSAKLPGEADLPEVWPEPLPVVLNALRVHKTVKTLQANLPDVPIIAARWVK